MTKFTHAIIIFILLSFNPLAHADSDKATVNVTVTVIIPPCVINNNNPIDVNFGNFSSLDVAAGTVILPVTYTLDCSSANSSKIMQMHINGTGADFDSSVLITSMDGLGAKFKENGKDYPINTPLNMGNSADKPDLQVQLVSDPGKNLAGGEFTAVATMSIEYQ